MVMSTRRAQCLPRVASNTLPTKEKEDVLGMLGLCLSFPFRFHFIFYALAFNPCRKITAQALQSSGFRLSHLPISTFALDVSLHSTSYMLGDS